jgi:hypothetical protein
MLENLDRAPTSQKYAVAALHLLFYSFPVEESILSEPDPVPHWIRIL